MINRTPFIIAEMSGNHGGSLLRALEIIAAAKKCGCDAVKIQLYEPQDLGDPSNNEIYEKSRIPREWVPHLFNAAKGLGIPLFSSVFAKWAVLYLERFNCPAYKLASPESTRLPKEQYIDLIYQIRESGKVFMASSGQQDMGDIIIYSPKVLFYCVAGYPALVGQGDIEYLSKMQRNGYIGFSDHSDDIKTPLAMIAAGAHVIEKHFKLDDDCIDAAFSLNPEQMKLLCDIAHR